MTHVTTEVEERRKKSGEWMVGDKSKNSIALVGSMFSRTNEQKKARSGLATQLTLTLFLSHPFSSHLVLVGRLSMVKEPCL